MKRLFIAVDLSIAVVEKLVLLQDEIVRRIESIDEEVRIRRVDAPNIHVTLKFLGDTEEALVPMLEEKLDELVKPLFPFEVHCQKLGAFPNPRKPRIIWAGLDEKGAEVMGLLRQAIERDLEELGFEPDRREFHPHITLARVKSRRAPDIRDLAEEFSSTRMGSSYIRDIVLYESKLDHRGARYEVLRRFPLGEH